MVTAFPELYFDEDIRPADASAAFKQALDHLRRWASQTTVALFSSVTGFHPPVCRKLFFAQTCAVATELWKFQLDDRGELGLTRQGTAKQVAEKPFGTVILRSPALRDDLPAQAGEESRSSMKMRRARSFSCRAGSG